MVVKKNLNLLPKDYTDAEQDCKNSKGLLQRITTSKQFVLHAAHTVLRISKKRNKQYKFWKDDNHAIYIGGLDTGLLGQKLDYIHDNPVKAMIVKEPENYIFSSAIDYCDGKGFVEIVKVQ